MAIHPTSTRLLYLEQSAKGIFPSFSEKGCTYTETYTQRGGKRCDGYRYACGDIYCVPRGIDWGVGLLTTVLSVDISPSVGISCAKEYATQRKRFDAPVFSVRLGEEYENLTIQCVMDKGKNNNIVPLFLSTH